MIYIIALWLSVYTFVQHENSNRRDIHIKQLKQDNANLEFENREIPILREKLIGEERDENKEMQ